MTNDVQISEREREILRLVATGATNQQIAQQLNISINTVKVHLRNIFGKIGAVSRTEATVYAIRNGLVTVEAEVGAAEADLEGPSPIVVLDLPEPAAPAAPPLAGLAAPASPAPVVSPDLSGPAAPPAAQAGRPRRVALIGGLAALVVLLVAGGLLARGALSPAPAPTAAAATAPAAAATRWFTRAPLPAPRSAFAMAAFDLERELYVIGGLADGAASGAVDRYDPASDLWVSLTEKPTPVGAAGAVALRGKIYVPGGEDASGAVSDVFEIYDPRERRWQTGPDLPAPRSRFALVAWEGRLYLIGGWDGEEARGEVFVFDPETEAWSEGPPLEIPRRDAGAVVAAGRLYVVGGEGPAGPLRDGVQLEPGGAGWAGIAPLPRPLVRPAIVAPVGTVLVFDPAAREGHQYDQAADAWRPLDVPPEAMVAPAAAQLDASIYFVAEAGAPAPGALGEYRAVYTVFLPNP